MPRSAPECLVLSRKSETQPGCEGTDGSVGVVTGTVSEVRLGSKLEQTAQSGQPAATASPGTAPTTGTPGATGTAGTSPATAATTSPARRSTTATASTTNQAAAAPAGAVVSYTAVINVDNSDGRIAPGSTAVVMPTGQRSDVVRVPNAALSFRPNADVLKASGQSRMALPTANPVDSSVADRLGYVWKYEARKFVPIAVETGVADERWTEVTAGGIKPGDRLVAQVQIPRR